MFVISTGNTTQDSTEQKEPSMEKVYSVSPLLANRKTLDPSSMPRKYPRIALRSLGNIQQEQQDESAALEVSNETHEDTPKSASEKQTLKQTIKPDDPLSASRSINNTPYKRKSIIVNTSIESSEENILPSQADDENENDTEDETSEISTIHLKDIQSSPQTYNSTGDIDGTSSNYSGNGIHSNPGNADVSMDSAVMLMNMNDETIVDTSNILQSAFSDYQQEIDKLEYGTQNRSSVKPPSESNGSQSHASSLTYEQEKTSHQMSARQALSGKLQHQDVPKATGKDPRYAPRHVLTIPSLSPAQKEKFHVLQYPGFISIQESNIGMFSEKRDVSGINIYHGARYCEYADCFLEPPSSVPLTGLKRTSLTFN
ncbi:DEBR0S4_08218g1_1 [Brettanomyces bruxellensis]|uniref:DEBR0S4_08218g1_1 n=1 Tax=Dekkera bruxellensis TaxID=5007 RepID=A0A7D9D099_DEKBR|nr:DEBR0S4_08218g1_1 [Brettanomyces bruxellensis]